MEQRGITSENLEAFKEAYQKALDGGLAQFDFEGQKVLTAYAKYVIEYIENQKK